MAKITKQKKDKINAIWFSYYTGLFSTPEEIDEYKFTCIGMSRSDYGCEVPIGKTVTVKECKTYRCECNHVKNLLDLRTRLASQVKEEREEKENRQELINIAKSIVEDVESADTSGDICTKSEDTGEREQAIEEEIKESGKRKRNIAETDIASEIDAEDMLFGD